jgi:uncharacterized membrane protein
MGDKKYRLILAAILCLGGVLLFIHLGLFDLWGDEVFTYPKGHNLSEVVAHTKIVRNAVHPPLYNILHFLWIHTFAQLDLVRNRLLYAGFGLLNIVMVYLLGRDLYHRRLGLIAAFLCATSPFLVMYSRMLRYYPLSAFLVLLTVWLFLRFKRSQSWVDWVWVTLAGVVLIYADYLGMIVLGVIYLYFLLHWKTSKPLFPKLLLTAGIIFVAFLPWLPVLLEQTGRVYDPYPMLAQKAMQEAPRVAQKQAGIRGIMFNSIFKVGFLYYVFTLGETIYPWRWFITLPVMIAVFLLFLKSLNRIRSPDNDSTRFLLFILVASLLFLVVLSEIHTNFSSRTFQLPSKVMFLLPLMILLVARGWDSLKSRNWKLALGCILIAGNAYSLNNYFTGRQFLNPKYLAPWRQIQTEIERTAQPPDLVLTDEEAFLKQLDISRSRCDVFGLVGALTETQDRFRRVGPYDLYLVIRYRGDEQITMEGLLVLDKLKALYPLLETRDYVPVSPEAARFWERFLGKKPNAYMVEVYRFKVATPIAPEVISNLEVEHGSKTEP